MKAERLVILISGRGSNALAIEEATRNGQLAARVNAVIADRPAAGLETMATRGVDTARISHCAYRDKTAFEQDLLHTIRGYSPDLVALAGFMRVLSEQFVSQFSGRLVNIHPSLLPRHRGLDTHRRVLAAGETSHGASVHFVTAELDAGPVLTQVRIPVQPEDRPETLEARLLKHEHRLYPATLALLNRNLVEYRHDGIFINGEPLAEPLLLDRDFGPDGELLAG